MRILTESYSKTGDGMLYAILEVAPGAALTNGDKNNNQDLKLFKSEFVEASATMKRNIPIILDLTGVESIDLYGMHAILLCSRLFRSVTRATRMYLMPSPKLWKYLQFMNLDGLPELVCSKEQAEEYLTRISIGQEHKNSRK